MYVVMDHDVGGLSNMFLSISKIGEKYYLITYSNDQHIGYIIRILLILYDKKPSYNFESLKI